MKTCRSVTKKLLKKNSLPVCLKEQVNATHLCQQHTEWSVLGQLYSILVFKFHYQDIQLFITEHFLHALLAD